MKLKSFKSKENDVIEYYYDIKKHTKFNTPIVFIHDFNSNKDTFINVHKPLNNDFPIIYYDFRGQGDSKLTLSIDIDLLLVDLFQIIKDAQVDSVNIVANGFGAHVAANFAKIYPRYVKSMVFEDFNPHITINNATIKTDLTDVAHPTLLLRGSQSKELSVESNQNIVMSNEYLRSSSIEKVNNNGHFHNSEAFVSQVSKFISIYS